MFISTTTLTSSPSDLTAVGQKQEACSSIGLLARQSPSDRPLTTPSSTTLSMAIRQPNWSEADTLFPDNRLIRRNGAARRGGHGIGQRRQLGHDRPDSAQPEARHGGGNLFQRGIAGPLAQAEDANAGVVRPATQRGECVGGGQSQVVVPVEF